ncbi:LTA synthase family protein [Caloramator sp. ALD01]|uniref:LTA synthase family protein n=1 Tax=Caloramator sp. ALD01 TaxID=1031288 RepID=UPI000480E845|nr:LTA synthase family protein [Caloramator sp. ALD01]
MNKVVRVFSLYLTFVIVLIFKILVFNNIVNINNNLINFISLLGVAFILLFILSLFGTQNFIKYSIVFNLLISFILIVNILNYTYFKDLVSIFNLRSIKYIDDVSESINRNFSINFMLVFVVDILYVIIIRFVFNKIKKDILNLKYMDILTKLSVLALAGVISVTSTVAYAKMKNSTVFNQFYNKHMIASSTNILMYHYLDLKRYIKNISSIYSTNEIKEANDSLKYYNEKDWLYGKYYGKNLLLLQLESFQGFVIGKKINGIEITPNLNKLAKEYYEVPNLYIQTSIGGTSDAEFVVNNGLLSIPDIPVYYTNNKFNNSLPRLFKDLGYKTFVMHPNDESFWNRGIVYRNIGIDRFYNKNDYKIDEKILLGLSDESFLKQSIEYIKLMPKPFYNMVITMSTHYPFRDKKFENELNVGELEGTLMGDYLKSIHYLDRQIGMFIDSLEKEGILKDTVIIIYGDHHGIPYNFRDELSKFLNIKIEDDYDWYNQFKVWGLVMLPDKAVTGKTEGIYGQADIYATVLHLFGINKPTTEISKSVFRKKDYVYLPQGIFKEKNRVYLMFTNKYKDYDLNELRRIDKRIEDKINKILKNNNIIVKYINR